MASSFHMQQPFYSAMPVQKYEEEDSGLDESIIDSGFGLSPDMVSPAMADSRRESFAVGAGIFSPRPDAWAVDMHAPVMSANPFVTNQNSNNPFARMDQAPLALFGTPAAAAAAAAWSMAGSPMHPFDGASYDPVTHANPFVRNLNNPAAFVASQMPVFPAMSVTTASTSPLTSSPDWMASTAQNHGMMRKNEPDSPIRTHNELRRGDGIRKKNARFEIPVERTLSNIDHLIAVCKNEADVKELKQQKRLLRNRQAA